MGVAFVNGATCSLNVYFGEVYSSSSVSLNKHIRSISITWDWDSDTQVSARMGVRGIDMSEHLFDKILIEYTQTANGKRSSEQLAVLFVYSANGQYENGEWEGNVELRSTLSVFQKKAALRNSFYNSANCSKISQLFSYICRLNSFSNNNAVIASGIADESIKDMFCKEEDKLIDVLKWCEGSKSQNHIGVNEYGMLTISPMPTSKTAYKTIETGKDYVFPGLEYSRDDAEIVNSVTIYSDYKSGSSTVYNGSVTATLSDSHPLSIKNTRIQNDYVEHLNEENTPTKAQLQKRANRILQQEQKKHGTEWTFPSMKNDSKIGDNIKHVHDGKIVKGLCVRIELSMDASNGCAPIQATTIREW